MATFETVELDLPYEMIGQLYVAAARENVSFNQYVKALITIALHDYGNIDILADEFDEDDGA
jgi:hypothetical protein